MWTSVRVQRSCQGSRPSQTFILCITTVQLHHKCWGGISKSEERRKCVLPPARAPFLWSVAWNNVCFWRCWHEHDSCNCGGEFWLSLPSFQPSSIDPSLGGLRCPPPALRAAHSARALLKYRVIGAELWGCSLCIMTNQSERAFVSCLSSSASNHFSPLKCLWCLRR